MSDNISISGIGGCLRGIVAERSGLTSFRDPASLRLMKLAGIEGTRHETWIAQDLHDIYNYQVWGAGHCAVCGRDGFHLELKMPDGIPLIGHADRMARDDSGITRVVEIKTMSRFVYVKWKKQGFSAFKKYAYQVSTYMHILDMPGLFVSKCRDTGELDIHILNEPPISFDAIVQRVLEIRTTTDPKLIEECDNVSNYPCGFCDLLDNPISFATATATDADLAQAAKSWREGAQKLGEGEDLQTQARAILEPTVDNNSRHRTVAGVNMTFIPESTTRRMNTAELERRVGADVVESAKVDTLRKSYVKIVDNAEAE